MKPLTSILACAGAWLACSCTTPLYYAVDQSPGSASGAWTQSPGAGPAASGSSAASAWPEGPAGGLYPAQSLDDLAWESELQADSAKGTLKDGGPTLPTRSELEAQAYGEMPRVTLQSGAARPVAPGSTGVGGYGANANQFGSGQDNPTAKRSAPDAGALVAEAPGTTGTLDPTMREVAADGSGRPYLFELFQEARDERDRLRVENEELLARTTDLQAQLQSLRDESAGSDSELERTRVERDTLRNEIEALQTEKEELEARLLTAQIRRLEAEKKLLEQWIQSELDQAAAGLSAAAARKSEAVEVGPR